MVAIEEGEGDRGAATGGTAAASGETIMAGCGSISGPDREFSQSRHGGRERSMCRGHFPGILAASSASVI